MPTLQTEYITILEVFSKLFSKRICEHAKTLLIGAILCPAERTVCAVLRVMGLSGEKQFQNYHRVLNRAIWSSLEASHLLLDLLINAFAIRGPVMMGLDDTIERRLGAKIKAKGIYRDPVRSTHSHFVKASGLRWLSLMLLAPVPCVVHPKSWTVVLNKVHCSREGVQHASQTKFQRRVQGKGGAGDYQRNQERG